MLKDSLTLSEAPCQLKTIGFQDVFSFYTKTDNPQRAELQSMVKLNSCITYRSFKEMRYSGFRCYLLLCPITDISLIGMQPAADNCYPELQLFITEAVPYEGHT